jgi:hypothetical protein
MADRRQNSDHDLLVTLHEQVKQIRTDIKELKDGTQTRLSNLETDRVTQKEYLDHENRLRFIEKYVWGAVGIIGLINLIGFAYIISKLTNH